MQVPAGLIDQGEDAAQAAVRELKEETGIAHVLVQTRAAALINSVTTATLLMCKLTCNQSQYL